MSWSLLVVLAACQASPTTHPLAPHKTSASSLVTAAVTSPGATQLTAVKASPTPTQAPAATPTVAASVLAVPEPASGTPLLKPTTPNATLAGNVAIDASYVVSAGNGTLISDHASSILAAGAASLSADGSQLIANNGGGLVANNTGNLITNNGGSLLSDHGVGLLSDHGVGLVAKTKYHLAAASGTDYGALLPAAGVEVAVRSMKTGQLVPLGVDAAGVPVYTVFTNLRGHYELYVPAEEAGNVLVEAHVPESQAQAQDPRMAYSLVAKPGTEAVVDEDTVATTRVLRAIFAGRVASFMIDDPARVMCQIAGTSGFSPAVSALFQGVLADVHDHARRAGITNDPAQYAAVLALATRCTDSLLAHVKLDDIMISHTASGHWGDNPNETPRKALPAVTDGLRTIREAAVKALKDDASYFDKQEYFINANACSPGRYSIKRPSDVNAYLIQEYMANSTDPGLERMETLLRQFGGDMTTEGFQTNHEINAGVDSLVEVLAQAIVANTDGAHDEINNQIDHFDPGQPFDSQSLPLAPYTPCPRPSFITGYQACDQATSAAAAP